MIQKSVHKTMLEKSSAFRARGSTFLKPRFQSLTARNSSQKMGRSWRCG